MKTIFRYNDGTFSNNPQGLDMCRMQVGDVVFLIDALPRTVTSVAYMQAGVTMIQVVFLSNELVRYEPTDLE